MGQCRSSAETWCLYYSHPCRLKDYESRWYVYHNHSHPEKQPPCGESQREACAMMHVNNTATSRYLVSRIPWPTPSPNHGRLHMGAEKGLSELSRSLKTNLEYRKRACRKTGQEKPKDKAPGGKVERKVCVSYFMSCYPLLTRSPLKC